MNKFKEFLQKRQEAPFNFAKRCGVSARTVYKIFHGSKPRKDVAKKIVRHSNKQLTLGDFGYGE